LNITINEELRSFIDPLTPVEYAALERSLLADGCRDALVLWRDVLIDGHNRYDICSKHGIPFRTVANDKFDSLEDVMLWVIDNNLARRSVSDFQRGVRYDAAARLRLDVNQLPKPFQVDALASREWQLASDWYRFPFTP